MLHSQKVLAQQVVQITVSQGIKKVVISPGSRNAPLIIEWNAYPDVEKYSLVDERSAAFFALGMALYSDEPVALVCTSGSALLNYYPALVEAFYSNVPLVIISADRPKHLIDIGDGQTIRQENVFQNHLAYNANLVEEEPEKNSPVLREAFQILKQKKTPIHINVPFSEPLYETTDTILARPITIGEYPLKDSLLDEKPLEVDFLQTFADKWNASQRKMVIVGLSRPDEMLQTQLDHLAKDPSVIILTESTSNIHNQLFINNIDRLIFPFTEEDFERLKPEILLTIGGQVVSKKIKSLLRNHLPEEHWHVDRYWSLDTYHGLTHYFDISPQLFFSQFFFLTKTQSSDYRDTLLQIDREKQAKHQDYLSQIPFSDLWVYEAINQKVPEKTNVVFSNSAAIRYSQFFNWKKTPFLSCNRGTSGIDGSTSTAIGFASVSKIPTVLVTGDLSFFYDSNALWNRYIPKNFKIIVVNNNGGGIFRFIPGPTTTNTLDFFETPHHLNAQNLCNMHGISYLKATDKEEVTQVWEDFYQATDKPVLLEIFTPRELNAEVLKNYFRAMRN